MPQPIYAVFKVEESTSKTARLLAISVQPNHATAAYSTQLLADLRKAHAENRRKLGTQRSDNALRQEVQPIGLFEQVAHSSSHAEAMEMA